jgi:hypothetical protein
MNENTHRVTLFYWYKKSKEDHDQVEQDVRKVKNDKVLQICYNL